MGIRIFLITFFMLWIIPLNASAGDYIIGQGDVLEISTWGVPEMSRTVVVRPDGKVTLPAVGDIVASHMTPEALSQYVTKQMEDYIKHPIVTVSVQEIHNNRIYIVGGGLSRVFDMVKETTLLKLLSELGDFSAVDLRHAYLSRQGKKLKVDFYALYFEGDLAQDIKLEAEDIIFMPSNRLNLVYVLGAVNAPKNLQFYEGMTVLDAILACGGFTEFAKENNVYIINKAKQKKKINLEHVSNGDDIGANVVLEPGDYVIVKESLF